MLSVNSTSERVIQSGADISGREMVAESKAPYFRARPSVLKILAMDRMGLTS